MQIQAIVRAGQTTLNFSSYLRQIIFNQHRLWAGGILIPRKQKAPTLQAINMQTYREKITAEKATESIKNWTPLVDKEVEGKIELGNIENWEKCILIDNCIIDIFDGTVTEFQRPVVFRNTRFKDCKFLYSYFLEGLLIKNYTFDSYLDLQAGGHNKIGHPIIIENNTFIRFVSFLDCWYKGEVSICNNNFIKGTNIESKKQMITFGISPKIFNNTGGTNMEAEFVA